jgi:hypothetical protein
VEKGLIKEDLGTTQLRKINAGHQVVTMGALTFLLCSNLLVEYTIQYCTVRGTLGLCPHEKGTKEKSEEGNKTLL